MKTLNDNTIIQLGNGILEKVRGKYSAVFNGTYNSATAGFTMSPYNSGGKVAINIGDIIVVYYDTLSETIYYADTDIPLYDKDYQYSIFTVIDVNVDLDGSIYMKATDKFGNVCSINTVTGTSWFIGLNKAVIPCTWKHTVWNSPNRIESLLLDTKVRLFKKGDRIKFGTATDEDFFNNKTVEIKKIEITEYTDSTHFNYKLSLENDFGNSEKVLMECAGTMSGSITEKQHRITTNCPTYILGTMNDSDVNNCTSIVLPKGNITIDAGLYKEYLPKVGDVVCAYNSPTLTDYGLYLASIEYIQTMDTPTPYAILGVAGMTFTKYYIVNNAFVTVVNTGGSGSDNVSN